MLEKIDTFSEKLEEYFLNNPSASVTCIDLSKAMLNALLEKFPDKRMNLICTY